VCPRNEYSIGIARVMAPVVRSAAMPMQWYPYAATTGLKFDCRDEVEGVGLLRRAARALVLKDEPIRMDLLW
jgi:hypothetical protein